MTLPVTVAAPVPGIRSGVRTPAPRSNGTSALPTGAVPVCFWLGYPARVDEVLLIGYGNTLRRDDGVGPMVARRFGGRRGIVVITALQLLPEHIEAVARAKLLILVDAAVDLGPGAVQCESLVPSDHRNALVDLHQLGPKDLVAGARQVFGRSPKAWLVTIGAQDVDFGEGLSEKVADAVDRAVDTIEAILRDCDLDG